MAMWQQGRRSAFHWHRFTELFTPKSIVKGAIAT